MVFPGSKLEQGGVKSNSSSQPHTSGGAAALPAARVLKWTASTLTTFDVGVSVAVERPVLERRIAICGSLSCYAKMLEVSLQLSQQKVPSVLPELVDERVAGVTSITDLERLRRRASMRHIRRVRDQRTLAVLAVNLDKDDIPDYVGPHTFAEIAIAVAHYKSIYLLQGVPVFYEEELLTWGARPLDGALDKLIADFFRNSLIESRQLDLFARPEE
jgi:hypothetical protein